MSSLPASNDALIVVANEWIGPRTIHTVTGLLLAHQINIAFSRSNAAATAEAKPS